MPTLPMSESCDRYLAPWLLSPFAKDLASRLARLKTGPLLEFAAGTGTLTRAIALAMPPGMTIVATDPEPPKLDTTSTGTPLARVIWKRADPAALPFPDASFGIITCHFGIASMADRAPALREARRVMMPGGRFVFSVPGPLRHNPAAECVHMALAALYPDNTPTFLAQQMHGYADEDMIDNDLTAAGFTDAMYTTVDLPLEVPASDVSLGYCLGTPLRRELNDDVPAKIGEALFKTAEALSIRFGSNVIETTMRATVVSASA
ncbi:MAG TPA: methyltransferase domain-containing protein [Rhodopila sp.]|nr:methyltransferase domain-containing protein [Rhodopila sp.]